MRTFFPFAVLALPLSSPALAQDTGDHHEEGTEIVVTGTFARQQTDLLSGVSIVSGAELVRDIRPSLGESLTRQAGVSATSFGPTASRPVLRGFQGERVRILSDGIGSFDVSNTSVDHAVVINPLNADRIEVLRGPAALMFGSSAIGGVVNVVDSRIPRHVPEETIHFDGLATYGSAANERSLGGRVDLGLGGRFVAHIDATYAKTGDMRTGGFILTPALRAETAISGDPEITDLADLKGKLPNSAARTWEVAGGLAWVGENGNFGASVSRFDSLYGVPVRYATVAPAPGEAVPEEVRLDVRQTRYDLRGEINPSSGFLDAIKLRAGHADYTHDELQKDGSVGTSFFAKGNEARFELVQRERGGWQGGSGIQYFDRKLNIIGAEKFLPKVKASQFGIFTLQSLDAGTFRGEAGARVELSKASAQADTILGNPDIRRSFTALSGSLGGNLEFANGWRMGLNASYSERAPSAEELFSNGPHAGTQAFELGNPAFGKERSKGLELTVRGVSGPFKLSTSLYKSWFGGFIYELPNGSEIDGLPVFQFRQNMARSYGAEFEAELALGKVGAFDLALDSLGDVTRTKIISAAGSINAPRIPALRLLSGVEAKSDKLDMRAEIERVAGQKRIALFETSTPGYTLVNASLTIHPWGKDGPASILLSGNNLFDVTARRHASFLKDYAPLAGRDIRISLKAAF